MAALRQMTRIGRPPTQAARVLDELRGRILRGDLEPGQQVPRRRDLEESLGICQVTIQSVINRLIDDGFLRVRPGQGTFVAEHPPHLTRFGLVLPFRADDTEHASKFFTALKQAATGVSRPPERRVQVYWGASEWKTRGGDAGRLLRDVEHEVVAGVVFAGPVYPYHGSPLLEKPDIPRVAIDQQVDVPGVVSVYPDFGMWLGEAMGRLRQLGRRKIALISSVIDAEGWHRKFTATVRQHGMETCERWMQFQHHISPPLALRHTARALWAGGPDDRPDGLLITDDNLGDAVLEGLIEEGVALGKDMDVVLHANFPAAPLPGLRVHRLGFDVRELLDASITVLSRARRGHAVARQTLVEPRFEE